MELLQYFCHTHLILIKKYLQLSSNNINYISFILYNDFPDLSDYLDDNYYNKDKIIKIEKLVNFPPSANASLINIDSTIVIKKLHDTNMSYSTILKYTPYSEYPFLKRYKVLDNIYIEFLNGICINEFKKKSPNWIKTYSCVLFDNNIININIFDNIKQTINSKDIKTNFFEDICKKKYNSAIFIENLKDTISFHNLLTDINSIF